jgi:plastocyanin
VARRSWLLIAEVALLGGLAAVAFPSSGSGYISPKSVSLTATGPSPSTLKMGAGNSLSFDNAGSVSHTVVFANGLCSLTIAPRKQSDTCAYLAFFVGSYAYSVDGKAPGMVDTTPAFRSVTLSARTHEIRRGERLTLHGRATWDNTCCEFATKAPFPVTVLARYAGTQTFKEIATVSMGVAGRDRRLAPEGATRGGDHLHRRSQRPTSGRRDLEAGQKPPAHSTDRPLGPLRKINTPRVAPPMPTASATGIAQSGVWGPNSCWAWAMSAGVQCVPHLTVGGTA